MSYVDNGHLWLPELSVVLAKDPRQWPSIRPRVTRYFGSLAAVWDPHLRPDHLAPLHSTLERVDAPRRAST